MEVDFGKYHHSTIEESRRIRAEAEALFSTRLLSLYASDSKLRILDAGCGLGFMCYVAAKCFPQAEITGVDIFGHESLSDGTLIQAIKNMEILGIHGRVSFLEHDLTKPLYPEGHYDLAISNLVFHNIGKKRFKAYGTVLDSLKSGGYFVTGDLFPHIGEELKFFRGRADIVSGTGEKKPSQWAYRIIVLKKA